MLILLVRALGLRLHFILSDTVPAIIPAALPDALEANEAVVASPAGVLDLVIHSALETDPSEDPPSSNHALVAPIISPFLFDDHFEPDSETDPFEDSSDSDASETPLSLKLYEATITRWRNAVLLRSSLLSRSSSSLSIPIPSTEVAATPVIPTLSMEATVSPSVVPTSPVRDTPPPVTNTTPTPRIIP
ncbi:hypothetical protein Tco_0213798 [Tanacetum coccineum]